METSKELTVKQSPQLPIILKDLVNKDFGNRELREYTPPELQLRNLPAEVRGMGVGHIITKVCILSGFKGEIPEINKEDITDLLLTRFQCLSLNELNFAFKIDRHGYHGDTTPHYQLFNAEYVAKVLNRYLKYKQEINMRPTRI